MRCIIAGAGGAAHLPGMIAALTTLPVLGVPVPGRHLSGYDSLLSIVQMPKGVPVATFAVGEAGAANAALFACALLASEPTPLSAINKRRAAALPARATAERLAGIVARLMLAPGATLGVLGGGQLGRMFVGAARTMGYRSVVLDPDRHSPAGTVADCHLCADYADEQALARFARDCDAVTTEFENVPAAALERLCRDVPVRPAAAAVALAQDRIAEKNFLRSVGMATAPYARSARRPRLGGRAAAADAAADIEARAPGLRRQRAARGARRTRRASRVRGARWRRVRRRAALAVGLRNLGDFGARRRRSLHVLPGRRKPPPAPAFSTPPRCRRRRRAHCKTRRAHRPRAPPPRWPTTACWRSSFLSRAKADC